MLQKKNIENEIAVLAFSELTDNELAIIDGGDGGIFSWLGAAIHRDICSCKPSPSSWSTDASGAAVPNYE